MPQEPQAIIKIARVDCCHHNRSNTASNCRSGWSVTLEHHILAKLQEWIAHHFLNGRNARSKFSCEAHCELRLRSGGTIEDRGKFPRQQAQKNRRALQFDLWKVQLCHTPLFLLQALPLPNTRVHCHWCVFDELMGCTHTAVSDALMVDTSGLAGHSEVAVMGESHGKRCVPHGLLQEAILEPCAFLAGFWLPFFFQAKAW